MKILLTFILLFNLQFAYSQVNTIVDTLDCYIFQSNFSKMSFNGVDSCFINRKRCDVEYCKRIYATIENYDSLTYQNLQKNDIKFIRFKYVNGIIDHTEYHVDPDLGPFGEYVNYYSNGKVKSVWQFQKANDKLSNYNIMEGLWVYYNENGDTIGTKRYKNGLAHGKWVTKENDSTFVYKYFKNGFSDSIWYVERWGDGRSDHVFHKGYYNGLFKMSENFKTILDTDEYVYQQNSHIILKKIKWGKHYIKKGKFYLLRDGIIIGLREYKNGEIVKKIEYDY